jgi:hypothetical protein
MSILSSRCMPDISGRRAGVSACEGIFFKILRCWVEAANLVGHLFREPQVTVLANRRVVRKVHPWWAHPTREYSRENR